jgi:hypothetical protein
MSVEALLREVQICILSGAKAMRQATSGMVVGDGAEQVASKLGAFV